MGMGHRSGSGQIFYFVILKLHISVNSEVVNLKLKHS